MNEHKIKYIDVFTNSPFSGSSVGVLTEAGKLPRAMVRRGSDRAKGD